MAGPRSDRPAPERALSTALCPPVSPPPWQTVVGVVEDVRYRGLNDVRLDMYLPATQSGNKSSP